MKNLNEDSNMLVLQVFSEVNVQRCSENTQQIYTRTTMPRCDFRLALFQETSWAPEKFLVPRLPVAGVPLHSTGRVKYALQVFKTAPKGTIDTRRIN